MQLQLNQPVATAYRSSSPGSAGTLAALVDAHQSERRLLDELIGIMRRQRSAVASDDLEGVDDSVFATHRILVTLGEARRRRRSLNTILGGSDELDTNALMDAFGGSIPKSLEEARDALRSSAGILANEVDVNRRVLREALSSGDEYMRRLVGVPDVARSDYSPAVTAQTDVGSGGLLIDRRI